MIKNLPAMRETGVWSLGQEDSLGEENGYPLQYSILAWRIPWMEEWWVGRAGGGAGSGKGQVHGVAKSQTWQTNAHCNTYCLISIINLQLEHLHLWDTVWENFHENGCISFFIPVKLAIIIKFYFAEILVLLLDLRISNLWRKAHSLSNCFNSLI